VLAEASLRTNSDGGHLTAPDVEAWRPPCASASPTPAAPADVGYVSPHATATEQGDRAGEASHRVFGARSR
jgi:3-oxoacyl-(acyl-carrier-protein) synthase